MDSAQKMMSSMGGVESLSGMLDQANDMMGSISPMLDKLNMGGASTKHSDILADPASVKKEGAAALKTLH